MTIRVLKIELKKALSGAAFKISLSFALVIVVWHLIYIYGLMQQLPLEAAQGRFTGKYNLFYWWLAIDCVSPSYALFFTLFPAFSCLPYAWSFMTDRKKRYDYQQLIRCKPRVYFLSKYVAVFISGGLAIALPLAIDLLLAALFSPASIPSITFSMPGFSKGGFLTSVYYSQPWIFCFAFLLLDFLWAGAIASLSFVFALIYEAGIFAIIMPVLALYIWDIISSFTKQLYTVKTGRYLEFSVLRLIHACTNNPNPAWLQLSIISVLILLSTVATFILASKKDRI